MRPPEYPGAFGSPRLLRAVVFLVLGRVSEPVLFSSPKLGYGARNTVPWMPCGDDYTIRVLDRQRVVSRART